MLYNRCTIGIKEGFNTLNESFSPHSGLRGHREACDGDTSTKLAQGPERGRTEAATSTQARWATMALEEEVGFLLPGRRE